MMKFDYCISNPAFNIAEANNVAGTGGNTTLYKTATRNDFEHRLKENGTLINITLKGIITDLTQGYFKNYQVDWINLMDDIQVWPYNTCYFSVKKTARTTKAQINGGIASKIYSADPNDCFPMVYYSGSDKSMSKLFKATGANKVIRRLPGKNNTLPIYDKTDRTPDQLPKFAFTVLESRLSHYVTTEPILGGVMAYITTDTIEQAEKLKLFTKNNPVFRTYTKRINQRKHTFALRTVRKFDLDQIITGTETPREWLITDQDLLPPKKLNNDIDECPERVKALGEVFTPTALVDQVLDKLALDDPTAFTDPDKTFIDSMSGNGQFLVEILNRKLQAGHDHQQALSTIYGIELNPDSVETCRKRLAQDNPQLQAIVERNIVCADSLKYDNSFGANLQTKTKRGAH